MEKNKILDKSRLGRGLSSLIPPLSKRLWQKGRRNLNPRLSPVPLMCRLPHPLRLRQQTGAS